MNRDPLFIRVDATRRSGYERLARCLTLAAAMQRRRRPVYFLSQLEPNSLAMTIQRAGNDWIDMSSPACSSEDTAEIMQEVRRLRPAAVLVDDAEVSSEYLAQLNETGTTVVAMDHLALTNFNSRLLVNPLLGPARDSYEFERGAQLLLGRRYALVRPEVRRYRPARSQEPPLLGGNGKPAAGPFRALLALGEDDPNRQVVTLAKLLAGMPKIGKVDIVVRREHADLNKIQGLVEQNPERLELALEPAEIAARLIRCHFALTSGSGWSLELACIGVPQLMILQNEHHWPNAQRLEEEGCASVLGWHENVSPQTIRLAVQNLLGDSAERQAMARSGRKLIDGRGPDRLVTALEIILSPSRNADIARQVAA